MKLQEMMEYFFRLYGRRNRIFLLGLRERIDFLNLAISDLQEAIRKESEIPIIEIALVRVIARIFCIAENFWKLPLVEIMARKYPAEYCSYCQKLPCICSEKRPAAQLEKLALEKQRHWSLKDWCSHLNKIYGPKNKEKGLENLLNRLFKEISELLSLSMRIPNMSTTASLDEIEEEFALELSDALAWTIAIANLLEVDLEKAVLNRYGQGCWKCHQIPCHCTHFSFEPVKWS